MPNKPSDQQAYRSDEHEVPVPHDSLFARVLAVLDRMVTAIEVVAAGILALAALWVLVDLVVFSVASLGRPVDRTVHLALDRILLLFVVVELFRIAVAYVEHQDVLHTVFEAGLVAVARKIVAFEYPTYGLGGAGAYAILVAVLVAGYFLLHRLSPKKGTGTTTSEQVT